MATHIATYFSLPDSIYISEWMAYVYNDVVSTLAGQAQHFCRRTHGELMNGLWVLLSSDGQY